MRVIIEINGERHRLLKGLPRLEDPCDKCSLEKVCHGRRYSENKKLIKEVCSITYSGFSKMKKEAK
jgi:MoaA/NifB/PqqE/SkfB family radical SAM enzyme